MFSARKNIDIKLCTIYTKGIRSYNMSFNLDVNFYKNAFDDLRHLSDNDLRNHWEQHGIHEKRLPNQEIFDEILPNFDCEAYLTYNPDITNLNCKESIKTHYWIHGQYEMRKYSHLSDNDLQECLKQHRKLIVPNLEIFDEMFPNFDNMFPNFDCDAYLTYNPDLKNFDSEKSFKHHYLIYGQYETRKCSHLTDNDLEQRSTPPSNTETFDKMFPLFDCEAYLTYNPDLKNFDSEKSIKCHYLMYGQYETRKCSHNEPFVDKYPYLFHKYALKLSHPQNPIPYEIKQTPPTENATNGNEFVCHLHIYKISDFEIIYGDYVTNLISEYKVIITYSEGIIPPLLLLKPVTIIRIQNKGFDIGAKIVALEYLKNINYDYNYILFLHSKSNLKRRKEYFDPLVKNINRIKLTKICLKYRNVMGIFPNVHVVDKTNLDELFKYNLFKYNEKYYREMLQYLNVEDDFRSFSEGNCFICNKTLINLVFNNNYQMFYNILNEKNSFDANWVKIFYINGEGDSVCDFRRVNNICDTYLNYLNNDLIGNNIAIANTNETLPDAMIEHMFERIWLTVIKKNNANFLILNESSVIDFYEIKINAIYFPQFHEIAENNKFWGEGFTEWTLLKPYANSYNNMDDVEINILKPHEDIGYYDLNLKDTLCKQIKIAENFNINGFVIYHYWFDDNTKILYKPLEYFLDMDVKFPFCISWANETWSRRWDGSNDEVLIEQKYGNEKSFIKHINYLIPFFKKTNYMTNSMGEKLLYIYSIHSVQCFDEMRNAWNKVLKKHNLKIKIIATENSFVINHDNKLGLDNFIFEPMYSSVFVDYPKRDAIPENEFDVAYYKNNNAGLHVLTDDYAHTHYVNYGINENRNVNGKHSHALINYDEIVNNYKNNKYGNLMNKHLGLPLYWNNIIRRKNLPYVCIDNFNNANLEELLLQLLSVIVTKYSNVISFEKEKTNYENIININAWNEWNEQAILEPNNVTGYNNLIVINDIIKNL